jgi:hypothetical protein
VARSSEAATREAIFSPTIVIIGVPLHLQVRGGMGK